MPLDGQIGIGTIQRLLSNVVFKGEVWLKTVLISFPNQHPRSPPKNNQNALLLVQLPRHSLIEPFFDGSPHLAFPLLEFY